MIIQNNNLIEPNVSQLNEVVDYTSKLNLKNKIMNIDKTRLENESLSSCLGVVINSISDDGLIELYRLAYNDGFDNVGDKKDIIKHRQKQIDKIKKKYCL